MPLWNGREVLGFKLKSTKELFQAEGYERVIGEQVIDTWHKILDAQEAHRYLNLSIICEWRAGEALRVEFEELPGRPFPMNWFDAVYK
jgi:hypothetical protein